MELKPGDQVSIKLDVKEIIESAEGVRYVLWAKESQSYPNRIEVEGRDIEQ